MQKEWIFKVFIKFENGEAINEISDWLESLDYTKRARIRSIIAHFETQKNMGSKHFKSYKGHRYIYEIRFRFNELYYRLFGCFGPAEKEFTLLIKADKKAGRLIPRNVIEIAEDRRNLILKDRRHIDDFV